MNYSSRKLKFKRIRKIRVKRVLGAVFFTGALFLAVGSGIHALATASIPKQEIKTVSFEYTITDINSNGYYIGQNNKYKKYPGIAFTQANIKSGEHFNIGDHVVAVFDKDDVAEGLVDVRKGNE
jgi:hypothetical protein